MNKTKIDVTMWLITLGIVVTALVMSGCAIKQPGSRTIKYGDDGVTITSETTEGASTELADIEKEKTRQVCYKQEKIKTDKVVSLVGDNALVLVMLEQSRALNNALSLMKTGKNYDPCPSSTNSADVEIADSDMYKSIYHDGFDFLKSAAGIWGIVKVSSNLTDALTSGAGNTTIANSGSGNVTLTDSNNSSTIGGGSMGDIFTRPTTTTTINPPAAE